MQTHRDIPFADGEYTVRLGMAQIFAIQEKTGRGIGEVYARVIEGRMQGDGFQFGYGLNAKFAIEDLIEVCRQGLIGGGKGFVDGVEVEVKDHKATHLVRTYLHPDSGNPITKAWDMATIILDAAWNGYEPAIAEAQKKARTRRASRMDRARARSRKRRDHGDTAQRVAGDVPARLPGGSLPLAKDPGRR